MLSSFCLASLLLPITIFYIQTLSERRMVQGAPVLDSAINCTEKLELADAWKSRTMVDITTKPSKLLKETLGSVPFTTSSSAKPALLMMNENSNNHRAQFRLKQVVPVDLYSPCSMEDENWSENYLHGATDHSGDKFIDEKYSLDVNAEMEVIPDFVLGDNSEEQSEDERQLKVTLTQLIGKTRFGYDLLKEMIVKASHLQGLVTDMIRKHLIQECQHLELPDIMEIPKHHASDPNLVNALSGIYQTLANQTAHLYLIWTQQRKQSNRRNGCSQHSQPIRSFQAGKQGTTNRPMITNKRLHARRVADDFLIVSSNLRGLMCHFKQAFRLFDIPVPTRQIVQQVLSHTFTGSVACSRMSVVDCQLMKSSVRIFGDIEKFLRTNSDRFFGSKPPANRRPARTFRL